MERHRLRLDGRTYEVDVLRRTRTGADGVSIVQPSHNGQELTRVSLESIRRFTGQPHELWVVDNASSPETVEYLLAQSDVNLILNYTPPWGRRRFWQLPKAWWQQAGGGSYANGIALELAARFVETRYIFAMHNDALPCKTWWLEYLLSRIDGRVRGVGVRQDATRVRALHMSGFLFDFSLFAPLRMSFLPNLPTWDVGDLVTVRLREGGYVCLVCPNTFNEPELAQSEGVARSWASDLHCDRAVDDSGEIFFVHLGRGTSQLAGATSGPRQTTVDEWLSRVRCHLLEQS